MTQIIRNAYHIADMTRVGATSFFAARNGARRALRRLGDDFDRNNMDHQMFWAQGVANASNVLGGFEMDAEIEGRPRLTYRHKRHAFEHLMYDYVEFELVTS